MKIRLATTKDSGAISDLSRQLGYPSTTEEIRERLGFIEGNGHHAAYVAELPGGKVAGWVHVLIDLHLETGFFAEIAGLVVDEHNRGAGIGQKLVKASEDWAREKKCASIRVRTNIIRQDTHKFYERLGFEESKQQKSLSDFFEWPDKTLSIYGLRMRGRFLYGNL